MATGLLSQVSIIRQSMTPYFFVSLRLEQNIYHVLLFCTDTPAFGFSSFPLVPSSFLDMLSSRSGIVMEKAANQGQEQQQWEAALKCPRCESSNTKFCYFNNYSLSQPRHFCKACKRYWTRGGTLRNVPVGGGCRRKNKRPSCSGDNKIIEGASSSPPSSSVSAHQPQIMAMNNPLFYGTIPMNLQFPPPLTRFDHLDGLGSVPLFSSGFHDAVSTSSSPFSSYNSNFGSASSPTMASLALNGSRILKQPHDQVTSHFQNQSQMQQLWQISNHAGLSDILEFNNAWQISGSL